MECTGSVLEVGDHDPLSCYHRKIIFKGIFITFNLTETLEVLRLLGSDAQIALTKAKLEILAFQDPLDCDNSTFVINVIYTHIFVSKHSTLYRSPPLSMVLC